MSMLAERKQKQRWFLNPRANNEWAHDPNKFGQKLLEKMGWTAGKGLGANENGITEPIRVKYKNDIEGIGYKLRDDQWTQHENSFTQLLANLGSGTEATKIDAPKPEKSLEKKSQKSRARVHYHKFTRGKDLASKSEKDLANIFGRRTLENPVKIKGKEASDNEEKESKAFGVVTIKSGNMTDYFKSKLEKLSDKFSLSKKEENGEESESEIGTTAGFGFNSGNKENNTQNFVSFISSGTKSAENEKPINKTHNFISFLSSTPLNEETGMKRKREEDEDTTKKKIKNKRKKNVAFDNKGNDIDLIEEVCYDNPCLNEEDSNIEENFEDGGLSNPAFDPNDEPKRRKSVTFASPLAEYSTINNDSPKKKKKKQKKQELGLDNPALEEFNETLALENKQPKNKKRKSTENIDEEFTPSKKSKKKRKNLENGIVNIACEEIETPVEGPKKSKKKKRTENVSVLAENTPKKSKKKKKENGITNFGCEESPNCVENLACSVDLIEEGIESITNAIDNYQTELENEMNIKKDKKLQKEKKLKRSMGANN